MNKTLLVVGASSEIGQAYIKKYHTRYEKILCTDCKNENAITQLRQELGNKIISKRLDLLQEDLITEFGEFLQNENLFPGFFLFLPAQVTQMKRVYQQDITSVKEDLEVDVLSVLTIFKYIIPNMIKEQFGRICFMLSSVTESPTAFNPSYHISKYALLGLMKAAAVELAPKKITVNAVSPTMIDTKFTAAVSPLAKKKRIEDSPLKRLATPDDVIVPIAHLLDEENCFETGQNILLSGGMMF